MKTTLLALAVCLLTAAPARAQAPAAPPAAPAAPATPTATVAPEIPGVVSGGTPVEVFATNLRGTEGPIPHPDGMSLVLTEQQVSIITKLDAGGNATVLLDATQGANGLTIDPQGRLIGTQPAKAAIAMFTPEYRVLADRFEGQPLLRPNDLVADRRGGVYFTDPGPNPAPGETLPRKPAVFYIQPGGAVVKVTDDITRPNGIILSPDERVLYIADTLGPAVIAYDVQPDGSVRNRRAFAALEGVTQTDTGVRSGADGLAVDEEGRLYVATQVGVQVFATDGQHLGTIPIGIPNGPQNLTFAGPNKQTLFVVGRGSVWKVAMRSRGPRNRAK